MLFAPGENARERNKNLDAWKMELHNCLEKFNSAAHAYSNEALKEVDAYTSLFYLSAFSKYLWILFSFKALPITSMPILFWANLKAKASIAGLRTKTL